MNELDSQLSNPFSTGGGGHNFETHVQAAFALLMLTESFAPCLPQWPIQKIKLQGKYAGYNTDDFIAFAKKPRSDQESKLLAQIKHSIAFTEKDKTFEEVINSAWTDFNNPELFDPENDSIALITGPLSSNDCEDVRRILEWARGSSDAADFNTKVGLARFSSKGKRAKLKAFRAQLEKANGRPISDDEMDSQWGAEKIGLFLSFLPFTLEAWVRCTRLLGEDESQYWTKVVADPREADAGLELAVDQLMLNGRPFAAIRCLDEIRLRNQTLDIARTVRAILAAPNSSEGAPARDDHEIIELIETLQDDPRISADDLFRIEWACLPLLDRSQGAFPKLLERMLANQPEFFCQIIRLAFRSRMANTPGNEPTEQDKNKAGNAYRLLNEWRIPPGCMEDGSFDGGVLTNWLDAVKKECSETGHLEIAMEMVGHVLIHTPADPDGLWIDRSAAAVLNARDSRQMREGFFIALSNSRGVHGFSAGREEQELSAKYRSQAEAVEMVGFHRLANTLRELAESYERYAALQISEHTSED